MPPRRPRVPPDILSITRDSLGTADPVTVFGSLLDAALRATRTMPLEHPMRKAILGDAMDRIYEELHRTSPVESEWARPVPDRVGRLREPRPVLRP